MKKQILFLSCLLGTVFLTSCEKEEHIIESQVVVNENNNYQKLNNEASLDEKIDYKRAHLFTIADGLLNFNSEISEIVRTLEVNEDDEIVISAKYLFENMLVENNHLENNSLIQNVLISLDAFIGLEEEEDWHPVLTYKNAGEFVLEQTIETSNLIIAIEDVEDYTKVYKGYEKINGSTVQIEETLTPELVGENYLIIMELSPCEFNNHAPCDYNSGNNGGSGSYTARINKMTVKHHKEPWPGRSRVHFQGFSLPSPPQHSGDCGDYIYGSVNCYNYLGKEMGVFKRSWVNNQTERTVNFYLTTPNNSNANIIFYVIFEKDGWPAPVKAETFPFSNGQSRNVYYRSWESPYHSVMLNGNISSNPYNLPSIYSYSYNGASIKYNF